MRGTVMNSYGHFCRPGLVPLLEALGLDATYVKAEGDYVYYERGGQLVRVLDLLGGYGANLFGHHHPELIAEARGLLDAKVPIHAQASCRGGAARLAAALCQRLGDYVVTFTNSGTETTEAAIKHAPLDGGRAWFGRGRGTFPGKTPGAFHSPWPYRHRYAAGGPGVRSLAPRDRADLADPFACAEAAGGALREPFAGEGGIKPL